MKISKLFHWLYAILMFLPIMVFIPNAFYYGFNEQAVAQEKTEQVPVYYESNLVNSYLDLQLDHIYHFTGNNSSVPAISGANQIFGIKKTNNLSWLPNFNLLTDIKFARTSNSNIYLLCMFSGTSTWVAVNDRSFDFVYNDSLIITYVDDLMQYISESTYQLETGEYQPLVTNMSITDSMSYAWKSTWQNDLFSWSYDSFLTQPFLYITNLFNVPETNTLLYCLSYWLNISIIWLCFDVVMYVPLFVHRWLDKGIVE